MSFAGHRREPSSSSTSSSSSGSDSDDAPLATLLMPKRPGSAASNATSGSRPRVPSKPLIDIGSIGGPALPMPVFGDTSFTVSPTDEKFTPPSLPEKDSKNEEEKERKPTLSDRLARVAQIAATSTPAGKSVDSFSTPSPVDTRKRGGSLDLLRDPEAVPNGAFTPSGKSAIKESPHMSPPTRSQTAPIGFDLSIPTSPTLRQPMQSNTSSPSNIDRARTPDPTQTNVSRRNEKRYSTPTSPKPSGTSFAVSTDPTPIRPTPIKARSPPPAFSVTSRPASQLSFGTSGGGHGHSQSMATLQVRPESRLKHEQPTVRMIGGTSRALPSAESTTDESSDEESDSDNEPVPRQKPAQTPAPASSTSPQPRPPRRGSSDVLAAPPPRTSSMYALDMDFTSTKLLIPAASVAGSTVSSNSAASSPVSTSATRKRASTLVPNGGTDPSKGFTGGGLLANYPLSESRPKPKPSNSIDQLPVKLPMSVIKGPSSVQAGGPMRTRQRSSTMFENSPTEKYPERPSLPTASTSPPAKPPRASGRPSAAQPLVSPGHSALPPPRPFAGGVRGNSPSASSTGDSSSTGRTPLTPRDGSEIGVGMRRGDRDRDSEVGSTTTGRYSSKASVVSGSAGGAANGMRKGHGHKKSASVSFDESGDTGKEKERLSSDDDRRRERRRSEAKAAIEVCFKWKLSEFGAHAFSFIARKCLQRPWSYRRR